MLTLIMCRAMNRSIANVVFGGYSTAPKKVVADGDVDTREPTMTDVATSVEALAGAKEIMIVPGYGLAVASAQYPLFDLVSTLKSRGTKVRWAIHAVAGRLPGQLNVLLAGKRVLFAVLWAARGRAVHLLSGGVVAGEKPIVCLALRQSERKPWTPQL